MTVESTGRPALIAGWVFAVSFFVGLFLVGDQAGAFADSDRAYAELFGDASRRLEDLTGSALLIVAAIAFGAFTHLVAPALGPDEDRYGWTVVIRVSGLLAAASILVAGAVFATVPASLVMGDFFGDPGIVTGQNLLPSLGYILLVFGAVIPAAVVMVGSTRLGLFPRWFVWVTLVLAVVLIVTGPMVSAMALLLIWVAGAAVLQSRNKRKTNQPPASVTDHA
jgi:MFS family permease